MKTLKNCKYLAMTGLAALTLSASPFFQSPIDATAYAQSASQRVIVIVNDNPITSYDVTQRLRMNKALGYNRGNAKAQKKQALQQLIDDVIKRSEGKKYKLKVKKAQLDAAIESLAKGSGTNAAGLEAKLKSKGVSIKAFRDQLEATLMFRWILTGKYKVKIDVTDSEVDKKYASISSDPRLKPITVYRIREVILPIGAVSPAMKPQVIQARAIEAKQIAAKYKGCHTASRAAKGIFDVRVKRIVEAPANRLPPKLKSVLRKAGPKRLIGPMMSPQGVRLIGFCGTRKIVPPKPEKKVVKSILRNEKYRNATERVMRELRRKAYIDYKDRSILTQ